MKVVIDTNIWVSFLIGGYLSGFKDLIINKKVTFYSSIEQIQEITDVLQRPKFTKYFTNKDVIDFLFFFNFTCKIVKIKEKVTVCRDRKIIL